MRLNALTQPDSLYRGLSSLFLDSLILDIYKRSKEPIAPYTSSISTASSSTILLCSLQSYEIRRGTEKRPCHEITGVESGKLWDRRYWFEHSVESKQPHLNVATTSPSISQEAAPPKDSTVELISNVITQLKVPFARRLAKRLDYLVEASREEYPHQAPMVPESLRDFINYLQSIPNVRYPSVVLTTNGNIRLEWRKARNHHFAVEFLGDGNVRFVVFAQDPKHPERTTRVSGLTSADSLLSIVQPYGVFDWVSKQAMDVYGRVVRTLLNLSREENGIGVIEQRSTHQDIANMVGASQEMVSRIMKDLEIENYIKIGKNGVIEIPGKLPQDTDGPSERSAEAPRTAA